MAHSLPTLPYAYDVDDNVTYSLSDDAGGLFKIDTNSGVVSLVASASLDAEAAISHDITVVATSGDGSTIPATDAPVICANKLHTSASVSVRGATTSVSAPRSGSGRARR